MVLTKSTSGTVTLSGANTYSGGTNVNFGTLALGTSNVLRDDGAVTVNGGTFAIAGNSDTVGAVTLSTGATFRITLRRAGELTEDAHCSRPWISGRYQPSGS